MDITTGDFGLRYLWPVSNVLYRETGYKVAALLTFMPHM